MMRSWICYKSVLRCLENLQAYEPSSSLLWPCGICESVEKMLLRIDDAAMLLVRETPMLDSPLSDPLLSSGIGPSGKAHAKPWVGFAAVGSGAPGPRATGII
jgi:hypothetical protein